MYSSAAARTEGTGPDYCKTAMARLHFPEKDSCDEEI